MGQEKLDEKAKSKSQQRFFGMVDAYKKGDLKNPSKAIKKAADSMTKKEVKDFAKTKHKGLPNRVDEIFTLTKAQLLESFGGKSYTVHVDDFNLQLIKNALLEKAHSCSGQAKQSYLTCWADIKDEISAQ